MWASTKTVSLQGAVGHVVDIQVDVSHGKVFTAMVGRADAAINEARDRCRSAVLNSGFNWPTSQRITILLSPADLPKRGSHFDLGIAASVIAASSKQFPRERLAQMVLIGELTLDGRLRSVPGVLPMVMAAAERGIDQVVVPESQVEEAAMVAGITVHGVRSLAQALAVVCHQPLPPAPAVEPPTAAALLSWLGEERLEEVDLADVQGLPDARYALEVAAAGGHHVMLSGPKGAGKTTLAERLPTILPDLLPEERLELTAVCSLAGVLRPGQPPPLRPPFRAPHHTASRAGILGGGSGQVRPGEVSRAHLGVLFLDEFPLLPTDVIEALRQPLESGEITISRGDEEATFPARGIVVLACNPCPCGEFSGVHADNRCICSEVKRRQYRRKLSGPIGDRIDIIRHVEPLRPGFRSLPFEQPETSAQVRERVEAARTRQLQRYAGQSWRLNAHTPGPELTRSWPLTDEARQALDQEIYSGRLTRRGATRVHRLCWTIADLRGVERPGIAEFHAALRLRTGQPLELAMIEPQEAS